MRKLLAVAERERAMSRLKFNPKKCIAMSILINGRPKKNKITIKQLFSIVGTRPIKQLNLTKGFWYLDINILPFGVAKPGGKLLRELNLLAWLIIYILPIFTTQPTEIHCWNDSRNVLCLLRSSPAKMKAFEANRVSDIVTSLPKVRWQDVPSAENAADSATRGLSAEALKQFSLRWSGPAWLQDQVLWPNQLDLIDPVSLAVSTEPAVNTLSYIDNFQSFNRLTRVMARVLRWVYIPICPQVKVIRGYWPLKNLDPLAWRS